MRNMDSNRSTPIIRTESPSISEIIERFHRLKEERFKPKENIYLRPVAPAGWGGENKRHSDPGRVQCMSTIERPSSATQKMRNAIKDSVNPKRRLSLPSIFRPDTPPPLDDNEETGDVSARRTMDQQSRALVRRYSTSHVMHEYSKRDIKQLFRAGRRGSVDDVHTKPLVARPTESDEEHAKRWLTGEDLHFFYNMWDKKKKPKIRLPRKLPPVHSCVNNITEEDILRPRLNTM